MRNHLAALGAALFLMSGASLWAGPAQGKQGEIPSKADPRERDEGERGKPRVAGEDEELKRLFQDAGWVLGGEFVRSQAGPPPPVSPQTVYYFKECIHFKANRGTGPFRPGEETGFGVYGADPSLAKAEKGSRYLVFLPFDFGRVLASFPETPERVALLKRWREEGVRSREEITVFHKEAGLVAVVGQPKVVCKESYPCQHSWVFPVIKVLKGEVGDKLEFRGEYRSHNDIPTSLKIDSPSGKYILFVDWNRSDPIASIPWTDSIEKELAEGAAPAKGSRPTCLACGKADAVVPVVAYGRGQYPTEEQKERASRGEIHLVGCAIPGSHYCKTCKEAFYVKARE